MQMGFVLPILARSSFSFVGIPRRAEGTPAFRKVRFGQVKIKINHNHQKNYKSALAG